MRHLIATLGLAPVLIVQGRTVRRVTPRLPEPPGPRSGQAGHGAPLRLLIAGDSAAAGVGAASQAEALSGQLAARLSERFEFRWRLIARTGLTAAELLDLLSAETPASADVALVSIGVNDVTGMTRLPAWCATVRSLAQCLRARHGARRVLFSGLPPMHRFPALPQPLRWYLGARARELERALGQAVDREPGCELLRLELPFERRFMAEDGFHPGAEAYAHWARIVAEHIATAGPAGAANAAS